MGSDPRRAAGLRVLPSIRLQMSYVLHNGLTPKNSWESDTCQVDLLQVPLNVTRGIEKSLENIHCVFHHLPCADVQCEPNTMKGAFI